jgi:PAS domain S-box-containing protein
MQEKYASAIEPTSKARPGRSQNARPTLGLLMRDTAASWELSQWKGVVDAARERDVNLICFPGRNLREPGSFYAQANVLYDLCAEKTDGLIIFTGALGQYVNQEELEEFCKHFHPLPVVSVERAIGGIPTVFQGDYQSMRVAMVHLIEAHGYRHIAFIGGILGHLGHQERYRAYVDTLAEYGLPFDSNLVFPPTVSDDFAAITRWLLTKRKTDFNAVVGVSDMQALLAMQTLRAQGMRVPEDVAVVGFDNYAEARAIMPPLTTVQPSFYEIGQKAVEMALALITGEQVPEQVTLPGRLVVRESCGCSLAPVLQATVEEMTASGETLDAALAGHRERILSAMMAGVVIPIAGLDPQWATRLLDGLVADLTDSSNRQSPAGPNKATPGAFVRALDETLRRVADAGGDLGAWQGVLSELRRHTLPCLVGDAHTLYRADDLWGQARVLIGERVQRVQANQAFQAEQQANVLREIGQGLIATFDVEALTDVLAQGLPRLGIPSGYLSLYEDSKVPADWSKLVMAYNEKGCVELEAGRRRFPSRQLAPEGLMPQDRSYCLLVEPLYFRENQIGFALFEVGPREGAVYETLRAQISSALQGALLSQERKRGEQERERGEQERKRGEETLARERSLLRALIDNIPDRIYAKDTQSRFIICNLASARRMGKTSPDELVGKSDFDLVPRELAERFYADEQAIIRSGQPLLNREEPLEIVDGKVTRWNLATKVPLRDSQDNIVGIVSLGREITELKQTQLKLERNALQLRTAAEVSRAASSLLTLDELLPQVVELIRDRFDLYYVGLFLVDETGQHAVLQAGMGAGSAHEAGQKMLETHHQVEVGSASMVGWCIANRQARIALDVGQDAVRLANRLLPETRSEMALPLISRGQAIGALTIQSSQAAAFTEEDISILQTMAGQVANAIENARLYERAQTALKEMEATQRRYVQKAWAEYLPSAKTTHYEIGRPGSTPLGDAVLPEVQQAVEQQSTVALSGSGDTEGAAHSALVTPLTLRGSVIGVLGIHDDQETRQWTAEEIALVEAVADRMAQTADNLRLLDETQRRAARERLIGEITARIRGSATMDGVLNAAVREIGQVTGASSAAIDLELVETDGSQAER